MQNPSSSNNSQMPPPGFSVTLGLFLVAIGTAILLAGLYGPADWKRAPFWVIGVGASVFLLAGLKFLEAAAIGWNWISRSELRNKVCFAFIVTLLAIGGWWVTFSPGDFQASIGHGVHRHVSEISSAIPSGFTHAKNVLCRIAFFLGSLLTTAIGVGGWREVIECLRDNSNRSTTANWQPH